MQETEILSMMQLYDALNRRLYINESERQTFLGALSNQPLHIQALGLTLLHTGCRLSEALELTSASLQPDEQIIAIRSLKKRNQHHIREVPVPPVLCQTLSRLAEKTENAAQNQNNATGEVQLLWQSTKGKAINRVTAYRWIKEVMEEADIYGPQGSPKGLRHGFGIHAIRCGVQLNMLQKWMGHASIKTTAIYANAVGKEELEIASKMW